MARISFLISLLLITSLAQAGEVYRWVDDEGNVHFSDTAPEGAEKVDIPPLTTVPAIKIPESSSKTKNTDDKEHNSYKVTITSPADETAYHSAEGKVNIAVTSEPALSKGKKMIIKLDGKVVSEGKAMQLQLNNISRGTHTVTAEAQDSAGNTLSRATNTFTIHRPTVKRN